jgi:thymidylate kinase
MVLLKEKMNRIELIKEVLETLEDQQIDYCVLRNYNFLIENRNKLYPSEKSIDLVIAEDNFKQFNCLMKELGFRKRKPQFSLKHKAYFKITDEHIISFDVQIGGVYWNDLIYLGEKNIFKNKVKKSFFYVPSNEDTFIMLLVHSILGKRYFKEEYKEIITSLISRINKSFVLSELEKIFNKKIASEIFQLVLDHKFDQILRKKYFFISYFIFKSPTSALSFFKLFYRWIKWRKFLTPYPLISIIGPDGSGKSTFIKELYSFLSSLERKTLVVYSGRGKENIIPINRIGKKYKEKEIRELENNKLTNTPKQIKINKQTKKIVYTLSSFIYALDLMLRLIILFPKRYKKIILSDRYCSDIFLMENVPLLVRKLLLSIFPKPQLTFYVYNSPEILHQRKGHNLENLFWQLKNFEILNKKMGAISIKNDIKEKTILQINHKTISWLLTRWY